MQCVHHERKAPSREHDELPYQATFKPNEEEGFYSDCTIGAEGQATDAPSVSARSEQSAGDQVKENRLRGLASRQGLTLVTSSRDDYPGRYWLVTIESDTPNKHDRVMISPKTGLSLDRIEEYLKYGMTRAEIMNYLSQTYGPAFVDDLAKHLPQPPAESFELNPESRDIPK